MPATLIDRDFENLVIPDGLPLDPESGDGPRPANPVVALDPWEYEQAFSVGIRRFTANWGKRDAAHYEKKFMQADSIAQPAGAIAELAVAKHLGLYWPGTAWPGVDHENNKDRQDVFPSIEVRRVVKRENRGAIRQTDLGRSDILVVAYPIPEEFREVEILGWLKCDEAWEVGSWNQKKTYKGVLETQLRHIDTLTVSVGTTLTTGDQVAFA